MLSPRIITEFEVTSLFGMFDYRFALGSTHDGRTAHETLLYGDNGTGKTTLLRLMYHCISSVGGDGSRGYLCRVPFKSLGISLSSGHTIRFEKSELQGPVSAVATKNESIVGTYKFVPDNQFRILRETNPDVTSFVELLRELKIEQLV